MRKIQTAEMARISGGLDDATVCGIAVGVTYAGAYTLNVGVTLAGLAFMAIAC